MNLSFGWNATFLDGSRRVMLLKPGHGPKVVDRRICYEFDGLRLKRVDPVSGIAITDQISKIPPQTFEELRGICRDRWGNVAPKGAMER